MEEDREDLRIQLGWSAEQLEHVLRTKDITQLQLDIEQENLELYGQALGSQAEGPFAGGKILGHLDEIALLKKDPQVVPPITVEWHLSNRCNHQCPFCTFRSSVHQAPVKHVLFPDNLVKPLVVGLKELGVKAIVYSGGGEPLLNPSAPQIMDAVREAGIRQGLITNGANLHKDEYVRAVLNSCDWIRFSMDAGSDKIYKEMHGSTCDLWRTVEVLENFVRTRSKREVKRPKIGVSFLLTNFNYKDLLPAAALFREVGVDYFQVKPLVTSEEERISSGNIFWRKEVFDSLLALPSQAVRGQYEVYVLGFKFIDMVRGVWDKPFRRCYGHPFYPVVAATGEVFVCCLMIGNPEMNYGSLKDFFGGFRELWSRSRRLEIGESVDVGTCPVNCKLSETNKILEHVLGRQYEDPDFLN